MVAPLGISPPGGMLYNPLRGMLHLNSPPYTPSLNMTKRGAGGSDGRVIQDDCVQAAPPTEMLALLLLLLVHTQVR